MTLWNPQIHDQAVFRQDTAMTKKDDSDLPRQIRVALAGAGALKIQNHHVGFNCQNHRSVPAIMPFFAAGRRVNHWEYIITSPHQHPNRNTSFGELR